jgi:putative serine protease PepD
MLFRNIARGTVVAAALALCSSCITGRPALREAPVLDRVAPACVEILADGHLEGSGWVADADGHIVTASHVLQSDPKLIEVVWADGWRSFAVMVARDAGHDLSLLKAVKPPTNLAWLALAPQDARQGDPVFLYGSALYRHALFIPGHVSRAGLCHNYFEQLRLTMECYHIVAPSPPGTSGGPWLDARGRVVGNQSGFVNQGASSSGIAIVAPRDAIRRLVETRASVRHANLGCGFEELWTQQSGFVKRFPAGTEGVVTVPIEPDGPAAKAGLTRETLVLEADGKPVRFREDLLRAVRLHQPGDVMRLRILEPDRADPRLIEVTLGEI